MLFRQFLLGVIMTFTSIAAAQELEPRAYSPSPVGLNFLIFSYGHQTGDFLLDPTLPIEDAEASLNSTAIAYGRTFGIAGRSANMLAALPYVWARASGRVFEEHNNITRSGLADMRLRFAMNILGGPALTPKAFAARKPATTLGASLLAIAPTGQYDPAKLINIGSNRWSFRPDVGLAHPIGHWYLELYGGVWLFTENHNFFGSSRRKQKPIAAVQGHVSYTFRPHFWLAANATFYTGGRTIIDETIRADLQRNSRIGVALSFPVSRRYSAKIAWAHGVRTRIGGDFNSVAISLQYAWFD